MRLIDFFFLVALLYISLLISKIEKRLDRLDHPPKEPKVERCNYEGSSSHCFLPKDHSGAHKMGY